MKKRVITLVMVAGTIGAANAQVGINTDTPAATLDVAIDPLLKTTVAEGVLVPRISLNVLRSKNNAYGPEQNGAIVYVNDIVGIASGKTINVKSVGFYYYDADEEVWKTFGAGGGSSFVFSPASVAASTGINWSTFATNNYIEITSGASSINTPAASLFSGKTITIANKSGGNLTFLNADLSVSSLVVNGSLQLYSDGTRWYLLSGRN